MRRFATAVLLLGIGGLTGCGGEEAVDPAKLPPLTQEQLAAIQKEDEKVKEEEGTPIKVPKQYQAKNKRRN